MKCPICRETTKDVYNTRSTKFGTQIWRRRRCNSCGASFTTYEQVDLKFLRVRKPKQTKTHRYSRAQLFSSIYAAFHNSGGKPTVIDAVTDNVEAKLLDLKQDVLTSEEITGIVLATLKHFDNAAYLRYLSDHVDIASPARLRKYLK